MYVCNNANADLKFFISASKAEKMKHLKKLSRGKKTLSFTYKEFVSHQSVLTTSRNLKRLKDQLFLALKVRRNRAKCLPPRLERQRGKNRELLFHRVS